MKEFDKEEFLNNCCACGCNKSGRELVLEKIEQYKESEPEFVQQLIYYRDKLAAEDNKQIEYRKLRSELGENENKEVAAALRAYADKLEQKGPHFILYCKIPLLPIFSGKDEIEEYFSDIEVRMVKCPLGG